MGKIIEKPPKPVEVVMEKLPAKPIKRPLFFVLTLVASIAVLVTVFYLTGGRGEILNYGSEYLEGQEEVKEVEQILDRVKKHIVLPTDTDPMVAVVTDANRLMAEQPFYKSVENGHILIMYPNKAIIYDPQADILINVGPLIVQEPVQALPGNQ